MRVAEVKRVAADIAASEQRIDILVNNAGAIFSYRRLTAEGLERTFALNHMAYFVLSHSLREPLLAAAPARVVNTASAAHQSAKLDFDDLQFARAYNGVSAYQRSKLCNILFTRELSRRWAGTGITVNCLHPGFVASRFGKESGRVAPAGLAGCAGVCDLAGGGGGNHRVPRLFPGGRRCQRSLLLQMPGECHRRSGRRR